MSKTFKKGLLAAGIGAVWMGAAGTANAAGTITFGDDQYVSLGFGTIGTFNSTENGANNGTDRATDFNLYSSRLYVSGSLNKYIKGMFNTEITGEGNTGSSSNFEMIDAVGIFQLTPEVAIWAGRFLSPSSRANMAGPYYTSGIGYWQYISARYGWNGGTIGRDDGVAMVTTAFDDRFALSFGAFEGDRIFRFSGLANDVSGDYSSLPANPQQSDALMYAGRAQYSFWDKEPGYYGTGNYLGEKDIFTIGVAGRYKADGAASTTAVGDYSQITVDVLLEKKFAPGAISLEGAWYQYDTDDVFLSEQGDAFALSAGFIFSQQVGIGRFMPIAQYQQFDADNNVKTEQTEIGVKYVIDGYNAQVTGTWRSLDVSGAQSVDSVFLATQLQF